MIGSRLGPWVLEREIGRGGMGAVWFARRAAGARPGPPVAAVKVLANHMVHDPAALSRFQRESEVLGQLDHPNIVRFFEAGFDNGHHFYAMEYVDGPSLEAVRQDRGRLPWSDVLDLALEVCPALKHAHDRGVVHRDLKPANILLSSGEGRVASGEQKDTYALATRHSSIANPKLTDFGIAWVFAGEHLTATGTIVGTAEYLAPEQAAGKQPTKRSDLYSLGAVLYALVAGRPPFEGQPVELLHKHRYAPFDKPSRYAPDLPHDFEEVICQLLEKDPEKRPADAAVLARRLDSLRRKYQRKASQQTSAGARDATAEQPGPKSKTGPATMMAELVRAELEAERLGGPVKQFFNRPIVVISLFLVTLGLIVWGFLPPSASRLFERGASLMSSPEPDDWLEAVEYFDKLDAKHPDHEYKERVAVFRKKAQAHDDARIEFRNFRFSGPMSEAHWFYEKGLRLRQQGERDRADAVFRHIVGAFADVPEEKAWVEQAQKELGEPTNRERRGEERWRSVRRALEQARQLEKDGKAAEAAKLRESLRTLYADDPSARAVLAEGEK